MKSFAMAQTARCKGKIYPFSSEMADKQSIATERSESSKAHRTRSKRSKRNNSQDWVVTKFSLAENVQRFMQSIN